MKNANNGNAQAKYRAQTIEWKRSCILKDKRSRERSIFFLIFCCCCICWWQRRLCALSISGRYISRARSNKSSASWEFVLQLTIGLMGISFISMTNDRSTAFFRLFFLKQLKSSRSNKINKGARRVRKKLFSKRESNREK